MIFTDKDVFKDDSAEMFRNYVDEKSVSESEIELNFTAEFLQANLKRVYKLIENYTSQNKTLKLSIRADYLNFEVADTLQKLKENSNVSIIVKGIEYDESHDLDSIVKVQEESKEFIDYLKELDLSPLEKFLIIYNYVGTRVYKLEAKGENPGKSRSVYSVLKGDDIVCVGYANLLVYLCKQAGFENLKIITHGINAIKSQTGEPAPGHENNFVYIEDEKYNLKGWYYADACWDSRSSNKELPTVKYCLLTFQQAKKVLNGKYRSRSILFEDDLHKYSQLKDSEIERKFQEKPITFRDYEKRFNDEIELVISSGKYDNFMENLKNEGKSDKEIRMLVEDKIGQDFGLKKPDAKTVFALAKKDKEIRYNKFIEQLENSREIDKQTFIDALTQAYFKLSNDGEKAKSFAEEVAEESFKSEFEWRQLTLAGEGSVPNQSTSEK